MLLQDPSLVKDYVTAHGYLPESYYQAKLRDGNDGTTDRKQKAYSRHLDENMVSSGRWKH